MHFKLFILFVSKNITFLNLKNICRYLFASHTEINIVRSIFLTINNSEFSRVLYFFQVFPIFIILFFSAIRIQKNLLLVWVSLFYQAKYVNYFH